VQAHLTASAFPFGKANHMKDFERYKRRAERITAASEHSGNGLGHTIAWVMILIGVVVTGLQTHALALKGMSGSLLYASWLEIASWFPVVLLEGTAIGLIIGRLYTFKGREQRRLGHTASFIVWGSLAFNTIAQFAYSAGGELPELLVNYTRYVLPLCIVCVPYLWKWLLDLHPDSQERIATLEVEAEYNAQWRQIQREQNRQVVHAFRQGMNSPRVREAISGLTEKAAIQSAIHIIGAIDSTVDELQAEYNQVAGAPRRPVLTPATTTPNWKRGNGAAGVLD